MKIYDIGGGRVPAIDTDRKRALDAYVVGIDVDQNELDQAPPGSYDEWVCVDITRFEGKEEADLVICKAVLEHVRNVDDGFRAICSSLKVGGKAAVFAPSRNAVYARLNLLLPETWKNCALQRLQCQQGFPAHYDRCTPRDFRYLASRHGMEVVEEKVYFMSNYFQYFFPLYFLWRLWTLIFYWSSKNQAAESMSMVFEKRSC